MAALPRIGYILGDHAGIGPEIVSKALGHGARAHQPVLIGNRRLYARATGLPEGAIEFPFEDIPAGPDIHTGSITAGSGRLILESLERAMTMARSGQVDMLILAPITKQALRAAGSPYFSEFDAFAAWFGVESVGSVVQCGSVFRSTVVGHVPFANILERLTTDAIVRTGAGLWQMMERFPSPNLCLAVAALNPHAGEDGLFGDEEARIIAPAVNRLCAMGMDATGPFPADTVLLKARRKEVGGIVYLYHDQGNIATKSAFFEEGVVLYTNLPTPIASVGHGSALDIAGQNLASEANLLACTRSLLSYWDAKGP